MANGLGNLTARVFTLAEQETFQDGFIIDAKVLEKIKETRIKVGEKLEEFKLHEALATIWELISFGDSYINEHQIWKTKDKKVLASLVVLLDNIAYLLSPFLPETAQKITRCIQWSNNELKVKKGENLFPRLS
ncbi:MAG: class I tRNA ligase family protein [Candidatus Yanofskybacteria bacterium]|nr:class I tRNA ligase family protein [Candidatus Yanofskybacteria bacterium]